MNVSSTSTSPDRRSHPPDRSEPEYQRHPCTLEDRARRYRHLMPTGHAHPQPPPRGPRLRLLPSRSELRVPGACEGTPPCTKPLQVVVTGVQGIPQLAANQASGAAPGSCRRSARPHGTWLWQQRDPGFGWRPPHPSGGPRRLRAAGAGPGVPSRSGCRSDSERGIPPARA